MAIGQYEIWLCHWNGTRLAYLDGWLAMDYTRAVQGVGAISLRMSDSFDVSFIQEDYKLEVWRAAPGQTKRRENIYIIRGHRKETDADGLNSTVILGVDGNDLLNQRVVFGQEGDTYTRKTGLGGNLIKAYMRDAINGRFNSVRALVATYFTVAANANEWSEYASTPATWATEKSSFTENRLLETLMDTCNGIANRSTGRLYPLYWQVVPVSSVEYQLRTYKTLVGQDLSGQITITPDNSMSSPVYEFSSIEEKNAIVMLGFEIMPGVRTSAYVRNILRAGSTPFACREKPIDMGSGDFGDMSKRYTEELSDTDNRPRETFNCGLAEIETFRYGRDWDLGDKVSLSYRGFVYQPVIDLVRVTVEKTERVSVAFSIAQPLEIG